MSYELWVGIDTYWLLKNLSVKIMLYFCGIGNGTLWYSFVNIIRFGYNNLRNNYEIFTYNKGKNAFRSKLKTTRLGKIGKDNRKYS